MINNIAYFHLPGLFEFYDFYQKFLFVYFNHPEYFYDYCKIGSIYGAPSDCLWSGGRISYSNNDPKIVLSLMEKYNISSRLTFSNSELETKHLSDNKCNYLCKLLNDSNIKNGVIIYSDLLLDYLRNEYPNLYFVSSTTKVLTNFNDFYTEVNKDEFEYVVIDFRLNKQFAKLDTLSKSQKQKVEFLLNECCDFNCVDRKECYKNVSKINLGVDTDDCVCKSKDAKLGYSFSRAMKNPGFISLDDIKNIYLPMGFNNFKIEGRSLGSALILEFLLYYMCKPKYHINVREQIYLSNTLDLF